MDHRFLFQQGSTFVPFHEVCRRNWTTNWKMPVNFSFVLFKYYESSPGSERVVHRILEIVPISILILGLRDVEMFFQSCRQTGVW